MRKRREKGSEKEAMIKRSDKMRKGEGDKKARGEESKKEVRILNRKEVVREKNDA